MDPGRNEQVLKRADQLARNMEAIRCKIAVYSGKGGVGKTTIAVNLAVALAKQGKKVGFLDADIDCPNAHVLLGVDGKARIIDGMIKPIEKFGIKIMSMAFLVEEHDAIMWRGPMISKAITDMLAFGDWSDIDYLVIDMPPGTSDAAITTIQALPSITGFIGVTTPQALSGIDLKRSVSMLENMKVPLIGIIENMCSDVFGCSNDEQYIAHIPLMERAVKGGNDVPPVIYDSRLIQIYDVVINSIEKFQIKKEGV